MSKRTCIICETGPRELPDRTMLGRPVKRICRACHRQQVRGDLAAILADEREKEKATGK